MQLLRIMSPVRIPRTITLGAYKPIDDNKNNNSNSNSNIMTSTTNSSLFQNKNDQQHDDIPDGCCPMCGIQLYKIREGGKWRKGRAIPVNLQGQVENGHCLSCDQELERELTAPAIRAGQAQTTTTTTTTTCYIGEYNLYGQRHGPGELIWDNGDRYVGTFFNGLRDGKNGTLFLRDGSEYTGDWECNEMHGAGTRRFANGDVYTGEYAHGKRNGQGKLFFAANGDLYSGSWQNDAFHGFGRYYHKDGGRQALQGHFYEGYKQGKFKMQHPNGTLDIVRYDRDRLVGPGVRWSKDRNRTWLLQSSSTSTSTSSTAKNHHHQHHHHKGNRISIAEAVSIGYGCEEWERGDVSSSTMGGAAAPMWNQVL